MLAGAVWPLHPTGSDIVTRLALAVLASALLGFNRALNGHAAGLRTTMLVGVAAAVAMIQANLLLPSGGRDPGSFATLDLMRLPLGILTGVGFIGGGVILKHGTSVSGVTTAATLWIVTAVSLAFGGGQIGLGAVGTALAMVALYALKAVDRRIPRLQRGALEIVTDGDGTPPDLAPILKPFGCQVRFLRQVTDLDTQRNHVRFDVRWNEPLADGPTLRFLAAVRASYPVASFEMLPESDD